MGKERQVAQKEFRHLLTGQMDALSMGILSDAYSKLTYMDMGGMELYFYNDLYPVRLVEMQQGSLEDELESLTFLVIDQYNTSILTMEELEAIELWNLNGGVLLLGTGAYAEIYKTFMEMDQLNLAELHATGDAYYNSYLDDFYGGWFETMGNGSAMILPYSFAELSSLDEDYWYIEQEDFIRRLLESAARAKAFLEGRFNVSSQDVEELSYPILRHRILPSFDAISQGASEDDIIRVILAVKMPQI